ncbi:hypothetical protein LOZ58_006666 [Ophidiomyces ophidiicola]|nr:hypothetical protein LOZ65_005547 [Ophidiomyces ophidiicola]KAI1955785.1 hypothetical protein LOZ58_006666 [Ophidiomyces ophidiicola]
MILAFGCTRFPLGVVFLIISLAIQRIHALQLDLDNPQSVKDAAKTIAEGLVKHYPGTQPGQVPGLLPKPPYYWWLSGAMFGSLIDYWHFTGDSQYNNMTMEAMLFQVGEDNNYMPRNQTLGLGNDDQCFWALTAMTAAECKFPNPPSDKPQWLALVQAVLNSQIPRWDDKTCGGGLRWQAYSFNKGYDYKNSITNGCFTNIAARLALYTKNNTYAELAEKHWNWLDSTGLISNSYQVFDGTWVTNCSRFDHIQWSYNSGVVLAAAAAMYNFTGSDVWKKRVEGLVKGGDIFFPNGVMAEVACESNGKCNHDQRSFKAYLARWMAYTIKLAPFTRETLLQRLRTSAKAAAAQCNGPGNVCGIRWTEGTYDGRPGVGQQMSALEVIQSNLIDHVAGPANNATGISKGDPGAGTGKQRVVKVNAITMADRVGAGFLTAGILLATLGAAWWIIS